MVHTKFIATEYLDANESLSRIYNLPKLMSSANRKEYRNIDNQGNAQLYTIALKGFGTSFQSVPYTAPNTYVTRRAVKAWHDARMLMYKRAGIKLKDLGYGRSLRPYLNRRHMSGASGISVSGTAAVTEIDTEYDVDGDGDDSGIIPPYTGDNWTYSRAAVSTPMTNLMSDGNEANFYPADLVDTYSFMLCDSSVVESDSADSPDESTTGTDQDSFVSVGMLDEWLGSFAKAKTRDVSNETIDPDNALLQLVSQQAADKEEVLELAQDSKLELRPWDLGGSTHYTTWPQGILASSSAESSTIILQVPCGLLELRTDNGASADNVFWEIEVLDISDM